MVERMKKGIKILGKWQRKIKNEKYIYEKGHWKGNTRKGKRRLHRKKIEDIIPLCTEAEKKNDKKKNIYKCGRTYIKVKE